MVVVLFGLKSFVPALKNLDRSAIMLIPTLLLFIAKVLTVKNKNIEVQNSHWVVYRRLVLHLMLAGQRYLYDRAGHRHYRDLAPVRHALAGLV
jgi:hypothetical protein